MDMRCDPDIETFKFLPHIKSNFGGTASIICDLRDIKENKPIMGGSRNIALKMNELLQQRGFDVLVGTEWE